MAMCAQFADDKTNQKIFDIREREEEEALIRKADALRLNFVVPLTNTVDSDALRLIPESKAREFNILSYKLDGKELFLATSNPDDPKITEIIDSLKGAGYKIVLNVASKKRIELCFENYKTLSFATASTAGTVDITNEALTQYIGKVTKVADVRVILTDASTKKALHLSQLLEIILAGAIGTMASDIHVEPEENNARLRYRLDGMLYDVFTFDLKTFNLILSRLKLIAGMKLNIRKEAQDGRFSIITGDNEIEIRASIIPGGYGESIVLRVLNPKSIAVSMDTLGINDRLFPIIKELINRPQGMIMTTGPTGSGKTTTLYSFLRSVYSPEVKIITIEDPIEYKLEGIVQTQTDDEKGYTFLEGLRSAMRQDPDVLMIGEIRDEETARTAIDAALTGHLVFSTLHTNNAAGAFTRLIDLGVNPKVITSAVSAAMAQRLLRKLCPFCRKEVPIEDEDKKIIEEIIEGMKKKGPVLYKGAMCLPVGCDKCNNTGYKGRIGVYEAILSDAAIELAVRQNPSEREIMKAAEPQKILTMREDGIQKVLNGITSLEELKRIVGLTDFV